MQREINIVLAQLNLLVGDIEGNAELMVGYALKARDQLKADLIVFPELSLTAYPPEDLLLRSGLFRRVDAALTGMADAVKGIDMIVGLPSREGARLRNTACLLREGEVYACYHKQILPNYQVFDEKRYFDPGNSACIIDVKGLPVGITVCEDIWQPEPAEKAADAGAHLLININASPYHLGKYRQRRSILDARTNETHLPIVYVNQVGGQDELVFDGESMAVNRDGELMLRAPAFREGLYRVRYSFQDRDIVWGSEINPPLEEDHSTYEALVLGVRDYVIKNGFKGAVIGLSGGIDSALTLAIAVDALGARSVEAVMMPSRYTAQMSLEDARAQAETLGVPYQELSIESAFETILATLAEPFAGLPQDTTEENIQARIRGILLMALSNKQGRMVLTTGNKSEMAVGYATLYGDMAGGFAPLKDLAKTRVYRLAEYRNSRGLVIPQRVIDRPPSAELAPDQKDQDSLPPYDVLDPILEMFVEQDYSIGQIVAQGFDEATVSRVATMVLRNEYKRRQAPPGVRITQRAFGKDRRYPITTGYGKML
ncbi:MAG: NAD+ synthase [Gammaproteobacteria bacterium]|nr:NAD+ synthase [Gammaproteobacteria bacterium]